MLITILKTNRWIPIAALVLVASLGIIIYDNWRTPEYARRLEKVGYPISTASLNTINPQIDETQNASFLLDKAISKNRYPPEVLNQRHSELPVASYSQYSFYKEKHLDFDQSYPEELQKSLKTYVEFNKEALAITHKAATYPFLPHEPVHYQKYYILTRLVACEGIDALIRNDSEKLTQDIDTLLNFLPLLKQTIPYEISYVAKITTSLVENTINRGVPSVEALNQWKTRLYQIRKIDDHNLLNTILYLSIEEILANQNYTHPILANEWYATRLYMDFTDTWNNVSKIVFPRMHNDIYQLVEKKDSLSALQLLKTYQEKLHTLRVAFLPKNYKLSAYEPVPSIYRDFGTICYRNIISHINSYLAQSTYASVTQTGISLYLYGQEHGAFPESLKALVPEYLDAVPVNPFTEDEPILYRQEEDRVVVYIKDKDISFTLLKKILNKNTPSAAIQENQS